jgi:hypothetical protein
MPTDLSCLPKDSYEQEGGASLVQLEDEKTASSISSTKEEKKRRKKEKRLREEALRQLMEKDRAFSPTASGPEVEAGVEREDKRNKQPAQQPVEAEQAENNSVEPNEPGDGGDAFMIDVRPTPDNRKKLLAPSEDEDMEDGGALLQPGYTAAPSGKNRVIRRRMELVNRERAKIQKKLGVKEGSDENAQQVQELLNKFIKAYDAKAQKRELRKNERKRKETIRRRARGGRSLEKRGSRN